MLFIVVANLFESNSTLTKDKYNLGNKEYRFFDEKENKYLRTQKYIFTKLV